MLVDGLGGDAEIARELLRLAVLGHTHQALSFSRRELIQRVHRFTGTQPTGLVRRKQIAMRAIGHFSRMIPACLSAAPVHASLSTA